MSFRSVCGKNIQTSHKLARTNQFFANQIQYKFFLITLVYQRRLPSHNKEDLQSGRFKRETNTKVVINFCTISRARNFELCLSFYQFQPQNTCKPFELLVFTKGIPHQFYSILQVFLPPLLANIRFIAEFLKNLIKTQIVVSIRFISYTYVFERTEVFLIKWISKLIFMHLVPSSLNYS